MYALLASGLTLIFGVMRVINIAQGALLIFAAFLTYSIWDATGVDPLLTILVTTPVMFGLGWILYVGAVRRIRGAHMSSSVLLTFAIALVLEGLMGVIWGNTSHSVGRTTSTSRSRSASSSSRRRRSTASSWRRSCSPRCT